MKSFFKNLTTIFVIVCFARFAAAEGSLSLEHSLKPILPMESVMITVRMTNTTDHQIAFSQFVLRDPPLSMMEIVAPDGQVTQLCPVVDDPVGTYGNDTTKRLQPGESWTQTVTIGCAEGKSIFSTPGKHTLSLWLRMKEGSIRSVPLVVQVNEPEDAEELALDTLRKHDIQCLYEQPLYGSQDLCDQRIQTWTRLLDDLEGTVYADYARLAIARNCHRWLSSSRTLRRGSLEERLDRSATAEEALSGISKEFSLYPLVDYLRGGLAPQQKWTERQLQKRGEGTGRWR